MNNKNLNRNLRFFLSSTFQDMQKERDYLIRRTFPKLREIALNYGATITELDLRWGITDEESKLGQVLQICLEEVDNSIPFFIGIVGNRYGWIPTCNDVAEESIKTFPEVSSYIENEMSITEMEMEYGALGRKDEINAIFFISEEEPSKELSGENFRKLISLRKKIEENGRYPVFTYKTPEDIGNVIEEYIKSLLEALFGETDNTPLEQEIELQLRYCQAQATQYIPVSSQYDYLSEWITKGNNILLVKGNKGCGKSALLSHWTYSLYCLDLDDLLVIPIFVGHGNNHGSGIYIKKHILESLKRHIDGNLQADRLTREHDSKNDLDSELKDALKTITSFCIIVIDGIDQISSEEKDNFFKWIDSSMSGRVKVICSSAKDDSITRYLASNNADILKLEELNVSQKEFFIKEYLANKSKKIHDSELETITSIPLFDNMLALKTMLDTLVMFSNHEKLQRDIQDIIIASNSAKEFYQTILSIYNNEFDNRIVGDILSYIFVSNHGLFENEIINLCNIIPLEWSQVLRLLHPFLYEEQGRFLINHDIIKEAIESKYLENDIILVSQKKQELISFFERQKESTHALYELPFLYKDVEMFDKLYRHLMRGEVLDIFIEHNILALATFWRILHHSTNYKITDYIKKSYNVNCQSINVLGNLCLDCLKDANKAELFFREYYKRNEDAQADFDNSLKECFNDESIAYIEIMPEHLRHTGSLCGIGDVKYDEGDYDEALRLYHRTLGFLKETDDIYDIDFIRRNSEHIDLFYSRDSEYYRVAYAFNRLGITYDEVERKDIACIMYERALQYLALCNEDHRELIADVYHNYAISLESKDSQKTIRLFESALDIKKQIYGSKHPNIANTLCSMGAVCADKLNLHQKAIECYNLGISIQENMNREDRILADLYSNRGKQLLDLQAAVSDFNHAIEIYQNLNDIKRVANSYQMIAYAYYEKEEYEQAFLYYLVSFWFNYDINPYSKDSIYLKDVIEYIRGLFANSDTKISNETQSLYVSFIDLFNKNTDDDSIDRDMLVGAKIGELIQIVFQSDNGNTDNAMFRKLYFILMDMRRFYHDFQHLPNIPDCMIEFLLSFIGNKGIFNQMYYDFFNTIGISTWLNNDIDDILRWEGLCLALYSRHTIDSQDSNSLMLPCDSSLFDLKKFNITTENVLLPKVLQILNSFIYDVHIPTGNLENAKKTVDTILLFDPCNINFLDSKAEILYREGKNKDAVEIVKKISQADPTFYPENNKYLYNKIRKYL